MMKNKIQPVDIIPAPKKVEPEPVDPLTLNPSDDEFDDKDLDDFLG